MRSMTCPALGMKETESLTSLLNYYPWSLERHNCFRSTHLAEMEVEVACLGCSPYFPSGVRSAGYCLLKVMDYLVLVEVASWIHIPVDVDAVAAVASEVVVGAAFFLSSFVKRNRLC